MSTTFLKKYKVIGKVGEGSFSEVLKCQDKETGAIYAAKRLKKIKDSLADALKTPEVVAMRKLKQHPNILHLIESHFDPFPGKVTLIFELMDMSMYDLMKSRKSKDGFHRYLPESRVKNYLFQLLKGVEHLHRHGLFHRDIKPENILLKNEIVKLADLGSVRGIFCKPPYTEYISTRWYRSPECLLTTGYYGPKMDVWATGCVFFELLTLKPLFPGANEMDQINKIHNVLGTPNARLISKFRRHKSRNCEFYFPSKPGTGISALLPNVSDGGKDILKHMLVYDPETRPNVRRLLEHRYFNDLREQEALSRRHTWSLTQTSSPQTSDWQSTHMLSGTNNEKRKKSKRTSTTQRASDNQKIARVASNHNQRSENTDQTTAQTSSSKILSQHKKDDIFHQRIQGQQSSTQQPYHLQSVKCHVEKTWTTVINSNSLPSKSAFNTTFSSNRKLNLLSDTQTNKNQFNLPKIPIRQGSQKTLPARRGPGTITSLPTLDSGVTSSRNPVGRGMLPHVPPASFLRLPPIVVKKTAATLTSSNKNINDTGGGAAHYISTHGSTRSFLSNRMGVDKSRLPTIEEKPSARSDWKQM